MTDFEAEVVRTALQRMFRPGRYLDICTIDQCLKVAGIPAPHAEYDPLRALHCVHWSEMTAELREEVVMRVLALFRHPAFTVEGLDIPLIAPKRNARTGFLRRLMA
jgi:hypothetical protein